MPVGSGPVAAPDGPAAGCDLPALRLYTSGTTGETKGVVITVGNLLTQLDALTMALGWDDRTRVYTVQPLHSSSALVVSAVLPWATGASIALADRFRPESFWRDVRAERATTASLRPTLLRYMLAADDDGPPEIFTEVLSAAEPLPPETALAFEDRFDVAIRHVYSLSETTGMASTMPALPAWERRRWHADFGFPSIGSPLPHAEMAVLHPVTGHSVPPGIRGELAVRGAIVMQGYAGRPKATSEAFRGGWLHTGDEGFCRPGPDGRPVYFVTGRIRSRSPQTPPRP